MNNVLHGAGNQGCGEEENATMLEPPTPDLGDLCPACGAPLRGTENICPRCGLDFSLPEELRCGLLTPFGYGLCGFTTGILTGIAIAFATGGANVLQQAVLFAAVGGAAVATAAAQVGKRLAAQYRVSYEHLLLAMIGGSFALNLGTVFDVGSAEALGAVWVMASVIAYLLLRRYGYRHGTALRP